MYYISDVQAAWILRTSGCLSILFLCLQRALTRVLNSNASFSLWQFLYQNHQNQSHWLYHIELSLSYRASPSTFNTLLRLCTVLYLCGWGWMVGYWSWDQWSSTFNAGSCSLRTQWLSCPVHDSRKAKLDGFCATLSFLVFGSSAVVMTCIHALSFLNTLAIVS